MRAAPSGRGNPRSYGDSLYRYGIRIRDRQMSKFTGLSDTLVTPLQTLPGRGISLTTALATYGRSAPHYACLEEYQGSLRKGSMGCQPSKETWSFLATRSGGPTTLTTDYPIEWARERVFNDRKFRREQHSPVLEKPRPQGGFTRTTWPTCCVYPAECKAWTPFLSKEHQNACVVYLL